MNTNTVNAYTTLMNAENLSRKQTNKLVYQITLSNQARSVLIYVKNLTAKNKKYLVSLIDNAYCARLVLTIVEKLSKSLKSALLLKINNSHEARRVLCHATLNRNERKSLFEKLDNWLDFNCVLTFVDGLPKVEIKHLEKKLASFGG